MRIWLVWWPIEEMSSCHNKILAIINFVLLLLFLYYYKRQEQ